MSDAVVPIDQFTAPPVMLSGPEFDDLYRSQYNAMVRLAFVLVDTQEEAEEVVQDAFAALLTRYRHVDNPVAYLRRSVLNGARHRLRRRRVARAVVQPPIETSALPFNHVVDAVRRLPHRQRSMIVLRYEMQLSDAEIADVLRVPIGTVKSNLHRALARLRTEVER